MSTEHAISATGTAGKLRFQNWPPSTLLAVIVALVLPFNSQLPSVARALWFMCIVTLLGLPIVLRKPGQRPLYPAIWVLAGFASFVTVFTATLKASPVENLFIGAQLVLLIGFGPFAMTASALADTRFIPRISIAYLVGQTFSSIVAVLQLVVGPILGSKPLQGRAYGLAEHPNSLGYLACIGVLISLQMVLTTKFRVWTIGALVINVLALIASGSVSSMMAVSVGFVVLAVVNRNKFGRMLLGAIGCALVLWILAKFSAVFAFLPSVDSRYGQVTGQTESVSSWDLRTLTYEWAWDRIVDHPIIGVGLNAKYSGTFNGVTVTHNVFLRAWYQGGAFLALAMLLIIIGVLIVTANAIAHRRHGGEVAVLVAIFAFALTSALFEQRHFWLPVLAAWASLSATAVRQRETPNTANPPSRASNGSFNARFAPDCTRSASHSRLSGRSSLRGSS